MLSMTLARLWGFAFVFMFISGCGGPSGSVRRSVEDGIEVVTNPLEAPRTSGKPATFSLVEEYRIDLANEELAALGLGVVVGINVDAVGAVYCLASKTKEPWVFKFDRDGRFERAFGRTGQGPGELENPFFFCVALEGHVTVIGRGRKAVVFGPDGEALRDMRFPAYLRACVPLPNGNFVVIRYSYDREHFTIVDTLVLIGSDSRELGVLDAHALSGNVSVDGSGNVLSYDATPRVFHWTVAGEKTYVGRALRGYEILVFDENGRMIRKIRKEHRPVPVPEAYKDKWRAEFSPVDRDLKKLKFAEHMPATNGFAVDDQGRLFVSTFEPGPREGEVTWDVFDSGGALFARAVLPFSIPGDASNYRPTVAVCNERFYRLRDKTDGFQEIVVSRIEWK